MNPSDKIHILIADDHPLLRAGIRSRLETDAQLLVVGEAQNGLEALQQVEALAPDLLILDMEMPEMNGLEVVRTLREQGSKLKILVLSAYDDEHYVFNIMQAGISGYLTKDETLDKIVDAVKGICRGEKGWLSSSISTVFLERYHQVKENIAKQDTLTDREKEVLTHLAKGETTQAIADQLYISKTTLRKHLANIYEKIDVHSKSEAILWAIQNSLL